MPSFSGNWSSRQQFQGRGENLWPNVPGVPASVSATAGGQLCASIAFTAACGGYPGPVTYTVTSTPGGFTATGSGSPILVTGLSNGTSYTFKVKATNGTGTSACSGASNSVTARAYYSAAYTTPGTYSWVAPTAVTSVSVVAVGGGGAGNVGALGAGDGGGGGGLGYRNNYSVTPGNSYTVVVGGQAQASYFINACTVRGGGGANAATNPGIGGTYTGTGGGNGGAGGTEGGCFGTIGGGGGGAGGYAGAGGKGGNLTTSGSAGSGGGAGGGGGGTNVSTGGGGGGGGVGLFGQGSSGTGGAPCVGGGGGSGGGSGGSGYRFGCCCANAGGGSGGAYGGGGAGGATGGVGSGATGAVRIVWPGTCRQFPSTNVSTV